MNTAIYGKFTLKKQDCQAGKYPLILKNESSIIMADREQNTLSKYVIIYILWWFIQNYPGGWVLWAQM